MQTGKTYAKLKETADIFFASGRAPVSGQLKEFSAYLESQRPLFAVKSAFDLRGFPVLRPNIPPVGSDIHKNMLINKFLGKKDSRMQFSLTFALTYNCSLKCPHCYVTQYRQPGRKEMTVEEFKTVFAKIIRQAKTWHFDITGGEPLEHPQFFQIIRQLPAHQATAIVATNGRLIDKSMAALIRGANIAACKVSLDLYSGLAGLKKSLRAVKLLADAKIYVFAQIYLKKGFARYFPLNRIIEQCRNAGAGFAHFISPMTIGSLSGREDLYLTSAERKEIYFWQRYYQAKYAYPVLLFPDWEINSAGCLAARGRTYIDPYGDIHACNFIPRPYGNILKDDFGRVILAMQKDLAARGNECRRAGCRPGEISRLRRQIYGREPG